MGTPLEIMTLFCVERQAETIDAQRALQANGLPFADLSSQFLNHDFGIRSRRRHKPVTVANGRHGLLFKWYGRPQRTGHT